MEEHVADTDDQALQTMLTDAQWNSRSAMDQVAQEAREWVTNFQHGYNEIHCHSTLKFVTLNQRHPGEDIATFAQRNTLYEAAKTQRWAP